MLDKMSEKYGLNSNLVKGFVFGIIIISMIVAIIMFSGNNKSVNKEKVLKEVKNEDLITLFEKIDDNYSLKITEKINGVEKELYFDRDSYADLYDGSLIGEDGIMVYKNKKYIVYKSETEDISKTKLHVYKGDDSFINDPFYNIKLITNIIKYCELTPINDVKVNCKMNLSDYLKEYNIFYNKNIETIYDSKISFDIVHYSDEIGKILIDYTDINRAINGTEDNIFYGIKIVSIGKNDHSLLIKYFAKFLSK